MPETLLFPGQLHGSSDSGGAANSLLISDGTRGQWVASIDASKIGTGTLNQARLGSGSGGAGAKYLADNQTWITFPSGLPPTGTAGGDLSGSFPNPTVAKINGVTLGTVPATAGRFLVGDGSAWQSVAASGDLTLASTGAFTLASTAVSAASYGSANQVGTFTVDAKGRLTAASNVSIAIAASAITSGQLAVARGGTGVDLSATGGANQFVRQNSAGGNFSVSAIAVADLPSLAGDVTGALNANTVGKINGIAYNADPLTQYALLAGRSGGQTLIGGTASGNGLTLQSTSNATKGPISFGTSAYDEVNNRLGIGTASPIFPLHVTPPSISATSGAQGCAVITQAFTGANTTPSISQVVLAVTGNYSGASNQIYNTCMGFVCNVSAANTAFDNRAIFGSINLTHTSGTISGATIVSLSSNASGNGGTTTTLISSYVRNDCQTGHTVGSSFNHYIANALGSGTITTQYGLYIETLSTGGTNRPIYCQGGDSIHAGKFRFGGTSAPSFTVDATGDINCSGVFRVGGTAGQSFTFIKATGLSITFTGGIATGHT